MREIEEYIKNNRDQLDIDQPDDDRIWAEIRHKSAGKRRSMYRILKIAVSLLILFGSIYLFYSKVLSIKKPSEVFSLGTISNELAEKESFYLAVITKKMEEINQHEIDQDQFRSFYKELEYLDILDKEYLEDMKELGPNEKIIKAILNNYEKRVHLLEKLLNEIEKKQSHENLRIQISI